MTDPNRIYLQADDYPGMDDSPYEGRTWAVDNISGRDTEYVRADLYDKLLATMWDVGQRLNPCGACGTPACPGTAECPQSELLVKIEPLFTDEYRKSRRKGAAAQEAIAGEKVT